MPDVLLLTHSGDFFTIDRMMQALLDLGLQPVRLNTDQFPQQLKMSISLQQGAPPQISWQLAHTKFFLSELKGVWLRKIASPALDPQLPEEYRRICLRESAVTFQNSLALLGHLAWIDHPRAIQRAENKLWQLKTALESGLRIPHSLISNQPADVAQFYQQMQGQIIAKMSSPASQSMQKAPAFVPTSQVSQTDIADLQGLQYSPMIFQRQIEKAAELRIVYVAGQCFAARIVTRQALTDWRTAHTGQAHWQHFELPDNICRQLGLLMQQLELDFGAIDMIQTPEGEFVFLEVNPQGEWGMLERDLAYPIAATIAGALCQKMQKLSLL